MAEQNEQNEKNARAEYAKVYRDSSYFINAIISDYGFYRDFIHAVEDGGSELELKRRRLKKSIDEAWIDTIEESLVSLDNAIRHPMRYIEEREEVMPIELSHNINSRSLRHLAQHTDYINNIDENGVITPKKILNVFREETMQTYENKFLNTLIQRLYIFVDRRYRQLKEEGDSADSVAMDYTSSFKLGTSKGKIHFSVEVSEPNDLGKGGASMSERLERMHGIVTRYLTSEFVRSMGKSYVRPPILRTNAISKNKDLRQCLLLWQFIESYDKVGYDVAVQESAERPDETYIRDLYSTLALQYMMFRYNVLDEFGYGTEVLETGGTRVPLEPIFKTELKEVDAEDYNVYDTEYRRVLPLSSAGGRKLSADELRVRNAVDIALAADKLVQQQRRAAEKLQENARRLREKRQKLQARKKNKTPPKKAGHSAEN